MVGYYRRVLLKLSGEELKGVSGKAFDFSRIHELAGIIEKIHKKGVQLGLVIGGGNIWRYRDFKNAKMERVLSDSLGMLATIMNALALQSGLEQNGLSVRVCTAIDIPKLAESYIRRRAIHHLEKGYIVICAGGTGNPYFTTDSAAALRALELDCDILLKATNVNGVYEADPKENPKAKFFKEISFKQVLQKDLQVMDSTAISLCREAQIPIRVFKASPASNILKAISGEKIGTLVS